MTFVCPDCLRESWHPQDEQYGYCGACNEHTRDKRKAELGPHCAWVRVLPDGRELAAIRQIYNARLTIGPAGEQFIDDFYCYEDMGDVISAVRSWDGEGDPPGRWHRHGRSGRRRKWEGGVLIAEWVNE